jgi:hypothetical protein
VTHAGVVTFHQLSERLTRIEVNLDVQPDSLIERAARGMRHVKRAVRADLSRFKAYVEMEEHETGAWRGVIDEGKVKSSQRARSSSSSNGGRSSSKPKAKSSSGGRSRAASAKSSSSRSRGGSSTRKSGSSRKSSGSRS